MDIYLLASGCWRRPRAHCLLLHEPTKVSWDEILNLKAMTMKYIPLLPFQ